MTLAGYGPHPERTLTWRKFWYAWLHSYLRREREIRKTETFQRYLVVLQLSPKHAQEEWRNLQAQSQEEERSILAAMHDELPRSVRPLLGLRDIGRIVDRNSAVLHWWDEQIADAPPGSRQRAFLEAGKAQALSRISAGPGAGDGTQRVH